VSARVTFDRVGDGFKVVSSELEVSGKVAGIDDAGFLQAAEAAKDGCPISQALKGNVNLSVKASLEK
jgi:osmotically inducible protein OsmC